MNSIHNTNTTINDVLAIDLLKNYLTSFLTVEDWGKMSQVSKGWNQGFQTEKNQRINQKISALQSRIQDKEATIIRAWQPVDIDDIMREHDPDDWIYISGESRRKMVQDRNKLNEEVRNEVSQENKTLQTRIEKLQKMITQ